MIKGGPKHDMRQQDASYRCHWALGFLMYSTPGLIFFLSFIANSAGSNLHRQTLLCLFSIKWLSPSKEMLAGGKMAAMVNIPKPPDFIFLSEYYWNDQDAPCPLIFHVRILIWKMRSLGHWICKCWISHIKGRIVYRNGHVEISFILYWQKIDIFNLGLSHIPHWFWCKTTLMNWY